MNKYLSDILFTRSLKLIITLLIVMVFSNCRQQQTDYVPMRVVAELNIGECQKLELCNGESVNLKLVSIKEKRDMVRHALRGAEVELEVDGEKHIIFYGSYELPDAIANIKIDCPAIKSIFNGKGRNSWGLRKDARFRIWPKKSPLIEPGTIVYPIKQRWFAGPSQMSNEPTYVNQAEINQDGIYYHNDIDIGGAEGMDEIVSATTGLVVSAHSNTLKEYKNDFGGVREDVVYIIDKRGWYYRYSHMHNVDSTIQTGQQIKAGQHIGFIGKEGASGGWVHLHFGIKFKDTISGNWVCEDAYAYLYEAYVQENNPKLLAIARPHKVAFTGEAVCLDGSKSVGLNNDLVDTCWFLSDGTSANSAIHCKTYSKPGSYSEILKITDSEGNVAYDFCYVQIFSKENSVACIPTLQAAYYPTLNLKNKDTVFFLVRSFNCEGGNEMWDFGDGSEKVFVNSGSGKANNTSEGEFAKTFHTYDCAGDYIATVVRKDTNGISAYGHLHVKIED